jgi:hypothetical protein
VQILYVYQDPLLAWRFVQAREQEDGRNVPAHSFIDQYFAARDVVNALKTEFATDIMVDLLVKRIIMSLFRSKDALPEVSSTPFSDFIRNAPSREKKKVYATVLRRASESQNKVIERVRKKSLNR